MTLPQKEKYNYVSSNKVLITGGGGGAITETTEI